MKEGHGSAALAVGAGGFFLLFLNIFLSSIITIALSLSLSLGDGRI